MGETNSVTENDRKQQLLQQFKTWIESADGIETDLASQGNAESAIDLYTLFAEFAALKSEIKIESRQFKSAFEQFETLMQYLKNNYDNLLKARQRNDAEIQHLVLYAILPDILTIRDRIADGLEIMGQLTPNMIRKKRKYRKKKQLIENLKEGQTMLLERMDKFLQSQGVTPIESLGKPFDPNVMQAVQVSHLSAVADGEVVEEIQKGFMLGNKVLRLAQVVANKTVFIQTDNGS